MLFDPLEEKLDLPAALVEIGDGERRKVEVVGQKDEETLVFFIEIANAAEGSRVVLLRFSPAGHHRLIASDIGPGVDRMRVSPFQFDIVFGSRDEE